MARLSAATWRTLWFHGSARSRIARLFSSTLERPQADRRMPADLSIQIPRLVMAEGHLTRTRFAAMSRNIALLPLPAN